MAQLIQSWSGLTLEALLNLWNQILTVLPQILGALIVFIVGLILASILEIIVTKIIRLLKLDNLLTKMGMEEYFKRGGLRIDTGKFFGKIVYWFVVIAFLLAASDILKFYAFSDFIKNVLLYIPQIIVAVLIMLAAVVVANFLKTLIKASVAGAKLSGADFLGSLAWWLIALFGFVAAMGQLNIGGDILNIFVSGIAAMFALACGIAFGLGGKDYAAHLLSKLRKQFEPHE